MEELPGKSQSTSKANQMPQQVVNLQRVYANSFGIGVSEADLFVTLMINGRPSHQVFLAIPTARELVKSLQQAIGDFEKHETANKSKK